MFEEKFEGVEASNWDEIRGIWRIVDGAYRGVTVGSSSEFVANQTFKSLAKFDEPKKYVYSGKFKLDDLSHRTASIYFRSKGERSYVVQNSFRFGAWAAFESGIDHEKRKLFETSLSPRNPLAEHHYSFRSSIWYQFKLVVTESNVDYFLDGEHLFSFPIDAKQTPARIGVGGHFLAPTEFDEIKVELIK